MNTQAAVCKPACPHLCAFRHVAIVSVAARFPRIRRSTLMRLNAEFDQRVLVHSDELEWAPSPMAVSNLHLPSTSVCSSTRDELEWVPLPMAVSNLRLLSFCR